MIIYKCFSAKKDEEKKPHGSYKNKTTDNVHGISPTDIHVYICFVIKHVKVSFHNDMISVKYFHYNTHTVSKQLLLD